MEAVTYQDRGSTLLAGGEKLQFAIVIVTALLLRPVVRVVALGEQNAGSAA